ncbi:uncharacterized protein LOC119556915 [Drosophila subpulchrella]|uniref:uncharacterized protein LOC119556915 n=1 Tax=Drosophila subpulchrella TaxID=1486046 RepID=UPI0018A19EE7|nr:uncharacterized protein LOC119556915 [Drosophila subpulchrella]
MGDHADQNHDEVPTLEGVIWHDVVDRIEFECRAFSTGNMDALERRRQVECALNRVMPWNDVHFSRINLPHSHSFECNNPADYRRMMTENMGATTRVCIGTATFWCIPSLLQFHCNYFERHIRRGYRFREGADLTAVGFRAAYDWMRLQESLGNDIGAEQVVATLHTAMQLEMRALQTDCYRFLCGAHFREEIAFEVYLKALKYPELEALRKVMLQRIGVHFLAVVGGMHFRQMPLEDVITMISQDSLGVNSEVEVLFALICWLAHRPQESPSLMPQLIGCVRFTLMPLPVLRRLWDISSVSSSPSSTDGTFWLAFHNDLKMRERISFAITVASLRLLHPTRRAFLESLKDVEVEAPREWMYDEACSYHLPYPKGPYSHVVNGRGILSYVSQRAQGAREFQTTCSRRSRTLLPATNDLQTIEEVPEEDRGEENREEAAGPEPKSQDPTAATQQILDEGENNVADENVNRLEFHEPIRGLDRLVMEARLRTVAFLPWRNGLRMPATRPATEISPFLLPVEGVTAESEFRFGFKVFEDEDEEQNENYLSELKALCFELNLFLPHEDDPQPPELEVTPPEEQIHPLETYVKETDLLIRGLLKHLD